jgi:hypothetical protein
MSTTNSQNGEDSTEEGEISFPSNINFAIPQDQKLTNAVQWLVKKVKEKYPLQSTMRDLLVGIAGKDSIPIHSTILHCGGQTFTYKDAMHYTNDGHHGPRLRALMIQMCGTVQNGTKRCNECVK